LKFIQSLFLLLFIFSPGFARQIKLTPEANSARFYLRWNPLYWKQSGKTKA